LRSTPVSRAGDGCALPDVIAASHAAIVGTFVLYPMMIVAWWRLHRTGR
jgi:hypothetical protein